MSELERLKARKAALDKKIAAAARKESQARRKKEDTAKFTLGGLLIKLCEEHPPFREKIVGLFESQLANDLHQMVEYRRIALKDIWGWEIVARN